jgi:ATP-dependent DNA helicase RecQ
LFEELRKLRRQKAEERGLPPFAVFSDVTLRDLARRRPSTPQCMLAVHGVGETKCEQYAGDVLPLIAGYCRQHNLPLDAAAASPARARKSAADRPPTGAKQQAFELFTQGVSVDHVCGATGRAHATVEGYLVEFIDRQALCDPGAWVDPAVFERIRQAAAKAGGERLKPIFEALEGTIGYEQIRIALACLRNAAEQREGSTQPAEPAISHDPADEAAEEADAVSQLREPQQRGPIQAE